MHSFVDQTLAIHKNAEKTLINTMLLLENLFEGINISLLLF